MNPDFDKLNRLRVNAGKPELKVWKASQEALKQQIQRFLDDGYDDSVKGAAPLPPVEPEKPPVDFGPNSKADIPPTLADSPMSKMVDNSKPEIDQSKVHKHPARLARGTDTESHCRKAVADSREKTKKERKSLKESLKEAEKHHKKVVKKDNKKKKQPKIVQNDDGTATKTTTNGNVRELGKDLAQRIQQMHDNKHKDKRTDDENFTIPELARRLDIDPKVARAKLRRHEERINKLHTKGQDRWVFPNSAEKELTKILKGEK